jgi:hypothetical protein
VYEAKDLEWILTSYPTSSAVLLILLGDIYVNTVGILFL